MVHVCTVGLKLSTTESKIGDWVKEILPFAFISTILQHSSPFIYWRIDTTPSAHPLPSRVNRKFSWIFFFLLRWLGNYPYGMLRMVVLSHKSMSLHFRVAPLQHTRSTIPSLSIGIYYKISSATGVICSQHNCL